jgi:hypothetical protein
MNLLGCRAAGGVAAAQQHFKEPDDSGVMDLDAGLTNRPDRHRQCNPLNQWKVHMSIGVCTWKAAKRSAAAAAIQRIGQALFQEPPLV